MTKKYLTLQKKFQETETQLANIVSLRPDSTQTLYLVHCHVEMSQRLEFLRSLLSAEIASDPSRPQHLRHMSKRLDQLEHRFQEWGNSTMTTSPSGLVDHVDHINGGDDRVRDVDVDVGSTCSCTESCLDDDGDAADEGSVVDFKELPVVMFNADRNDNTTAAAMAETAVEEEGVVKLVDGKRSSEEKVETKSGGGRGNGGGGVGVGMIFGAVATGWVLGMVSMGLVMVVALSSEGFLFRLGGDHYGNFPTPT